MQTIQSEITVNLSMCLRSLTVRARMLATTLLVGVALAAVAAVGIAAQWRAKEANQRFIDHEFAAMTHIAQLRTTMGALRAIEKDMIIAFGKPDKVKALNATWTAVHERIATAARGLESLLAEPAQKAKVRDAIGRLDSFGKRFQGVATALATDAYDSPQSAVSFMARAQSEYDGAQAVVASLADDVQRSAVEGASQLGAFADRVVTLLTAVVVIALAIVLPVTLLNARTVIVPLREAEALARRIGGGDLSPGPVDLRGHDEPARLLAALVGMRDSLTGIVGTIRGSTESIHNAAGEIAIGNQDLSVRTEQTAANLQQAASSMEQIAATVRTSADAAQEAFRLSALATDTARRGGDVIADVVATMGRISDSSKRIADIISVIDGIAFQTNLLALNAAVEAARAGTAGRGFSVVASEVRSLAQRSAQAAHEIKALIGTSAGHVEEGTRKVGAAGSTMHELVTAVQRVSGIMSGISSSADEQKDSIGLVSGSVNQLDQMTQQNAALVEQSAAAAESLKDQAQRLAQAVDVFRLQQA